MPIKLSIQENGNLLISVCDREEFENIIRREYQDERAYLFDLLEHARYTGNDWHCPYEIGLTEAPAIGQGAIYPENEDYSGLPADYENLWFFADCQIKAYLEILHKKGWVIFTGHRDNLCKKRKME